MDVFGECMCQQTVKIEDNEYVFACACNRFWIIIVVWVRLCSLLLTRDFAGNSINIINVVQYANRYRFNNAQHISNIYGISVLSAWTNFGLTDDAIHIYVMRQLECWLWLNNPHCIWMCFAIVTQPLSVHTYISIHIQSECNNSRCHRELCVHGGEIVRIMLLWKYTR